MPRKKIPRAKPIESHSFELNGELWIVEIWNNLADECTRGAHKKYLRSKAFDAALLSVDNFLSIDSSAAKKTYEQYIDGRLTTADFGKKIITNLKSKNIKIGKTLSEEIARDIKNHYMAIKNALEEIESLKK